MAQQPNGNDMFINEIHAEVGGQFGRANSRISPNRMSRGRFSPDNGGGRGTLAGVLNGYGGNISRQSPQSRARGTTSQAGRASRAYAPSAAGFDNININSPDAIERDRHYAKIKQDLQRQFELIDVNNDGKVTKQELVDYMLGQTEQQMAQNRSQLGQEELLQMQESLDQIVDAIFARMDQNSDQFVGIDEFVNEYHTLYVQLEEEIEELQLRLKDQEQRAEQIQQRLQEMKRIEKPSSNYHPVFQNHSIMKGSILSVHVIDARALTPKFRNLANAQVRLEVENNHSSTKENPLSNNPVWNEVSTFDIEKGIDLLKVQVFDFEPEDGSRALGDRKRSLIGEVQINLADLSSDSIAWEQQFPDLLQKMQAGEFDEQMLEQEPPDIDQMKKDALYDLNPQGSGKIRISIQWIYSKVKLLDDILMHLRFQIYRDQYEKTFKEGELQDMLKPFGGFLKTAVTHQAMSLGEKNLVEVFKNFGTVSEEEKKMAKDVEQFMQRKGFKQVKWARATFVCTVLFTIMTCLVHFYKADFLNLTVCTVAIYLLSNAKESQPRYFRYLVAGIILSFGYDIAWLLLRTGDLAADEEGDGGVEVTIRKFSLVMTYISLVFKVIMTFVYWMASMRFEDIIDERSALI